MSQDDDSSAVRPSYTCPVCGWVSHHPTDAEEGYCGHCHGWTREPTP